MKHLAAYLLLGLGGNTSPSASDIKEVLKSVRIDANDERLEKLLSELQGKDIKQLISDGTCQLAIRPTVSAGRTPAAGVPAEEADEEEPKECGTF
ncbi:hypothetical protein BKA56DRAFT_574652 [Ilyonectria sp. MPI-CAGE-AT-0026]|nr:hypothetical protein BKA56DRAFT_574652 [Ilyonectria sp. MPI-CAGE-AT-0026]